MFGPLSREHLPQLVLKVDGDLEDAVDRARDGQEDRERDQGAEEDDVGRVYGAKRGESRHLESGFGGRRERGKFGELRVDRFSRSRKRERARERVRGQNESLQARTNWAAFRCVTPVAENSRCPCLS